MSWEIIDRWRDIGKRNIMFRLKNKMDGTAITCGVSQVAINDYFQTPDTPEQAEINLENHQQFVIGKALILQNLGRANSDGYYIVTKEFIASNS